MFVEYTNRYGKRLVLMSNLLTAFQQIQSVLKLQDLDIEMTDAWRGMAEQEAAQASGNSNAHFGQSAHNYGAAFDATFVINGTLTWPDSTNPLWKIYGELALNNGLKWGGEFSTGAFKNHGDMPHMELENWDKQDFMLYETEPPLNAG